MHVALRRKSVPCHQEVIYPLDVVLNLSLLIFPQAGKVRIIVIVQIVIKGPIRPEFGRAALILAGELGDRLQELSFSCTDADFNIIRHEVLHPEIAVVGALIGEVNSNGAWRAAPELYLSPGYSVVAKTGAELSV